MATTHTSFFLRNNRVYQSTKIHTKAQAFILLSYALESEGLITEQENETLIQEIHTAALNMYTEHGTRTPMIPDKNLFVSFSKSEVYQLHRISKKDQIDLFKEMIFDGEISKALHVLAGVENLSEIRDEDERNMYIDFCSIKEPNSDDIESFLNKVYNTETIS